MSATKLCDGCGAGLVDVEMSLEELLEVLRANGWLVSETVSLCPTCFGAAERSDRKERAA